MSQTYRYYFLDGAGHFRGAQWFEAESDKDAVALMDAKHPNGLCEIWHGNRLVLA